MVHLSGHGGYNCVLCDRTWDPYVEGQPYASGSGYKNVTVCCNQFLTHSVVLFHGSQVQTLHPYVWRVWTSDPYGEGRNFLSRRIHMRLVTETWDGRRNSPSQTIGKARRHAMTIEDSVSSGGGRKSPVTINMEVADGTAGVMNSAHNPSGWSWNFHTGCMMIVVVDETLHEGVYMTTEISMEPEKEVVNTIRWQPWQKWHGWHSSYGLKMKWKYYCIIFP